MKGNDRGKVPHRWFRLAIAAIAGIFAVGCAGDSPITVDNTVAVVAISPIVATVDPGDTILVVATPANANGAPLQGHAVAWSSSDASIARVNSTGVVVAGVVGSATITATTEGRSGSATITVKPQSVATAPINHVFIVVLENEDNSAVIGNPSMPYLNGLSQQYGMASQYYANTHPSIGNYFMMTVGMIITNDDNYSGIVDNDNVVRRLIAAGKTWKSYAENLPAVGYVAGDDGLYTRHHNVITLLSDVANDPVQRQNVVPFTQFATDLAAGTLPNYSMIVPNSCDDGHDCSLPTVDSWLHTNLDPLIKSAQFQKDGLLIIWWDESETSSAYGGGRIPWTIVGPSVKRGYQSATVYQHESTLRLSLEALGINGYPNAAATAPDMSEFLTP